MADPTPPVRPSRPALSTGRPSSGTSGRSIRPRIGEADKPVVAETTLIAPPPPPPVITVLRPPSVFANPVWRQTLLPPTLVTSLGCTALGVAYFLQPADAAMRQIASDLAVASLVAAGVLIAAAAVLAASLRR